MGSRCLAGGSHAAWLVRGTLSRSSRPALIRSSRDRNVGGASTALVVSVFVLLVIFFTIAMAAPVHCCSALSAAAVVSRLSCLRPAPKRSSQVEIKAAVSVPCTSIAQIHGVERTVRGDDDARVRTWASLEMTGITGTAAWKPD